MTFSIKIKDQYFSSIEELGENIYKYQDECYKIFESKKFLNFLIQNEKDIAIEFVKLWNKKTSKERFLFEVQYLFKPRMSIRHHGYEFKSFKAIGEKILSYGPDIDIYLKDFLKYKLLSYYFIIQGFDTKEKELYNKILKLEEEYLENPNKSYFKLGFLLANSKIIIYKNRPYDNPQIFFKDMMSDRFLAEFSFNLEKNQYVYAWLEIKGYKEIINRYKNLIDSVVEQEEKVNDYQRKI